MLKNIKFIHFLFCLLFFAGCSLYAQPKLDKPTAGQSEDSSEINLVEANFVETEIEKLEAEAVIEEERLKIAVIPDNPRPGEPITVAFTGVSGENFHASLLNPQGQRLARSAFFYFTKDNKGKIVQTAILAIPSTARSGLARIRIESSQENIGEVQINIANREFRSEEIALNQQNTDIRTAPNPQRIRESDQLWAILNRTGSDVYTFGPFMPPVESTRRTSLFGSRRVYRYVHGGTDVSIHAGVDYGVPTGTEVKASASGKVVLARSRIVTGNSVVIEHLPGVYSLYYHLDEIFVKEGAIITTGVVLGKSGSTGLSTGPHLHWEIRVSTENTDPDAFVARAILDKSAILSILDSL